MVRFADRRRQARPREAAFAVLRDHRRPIQRVPDADDDLRTRLDEFVRVLQDRHFVVVGIEPDQDAAAIAVVDPVRLLAELFSQVEILHSPPPHSSRPLLRRANSEEHTSELQSLMRSSYAVSCWTKKK